MADGHGEGSVAPRRSLGGPILPPPPPELAEEAKRKEREAAARAEKAAAKAARSAKKATRQQASAKKASAKKAGAKKATTRKSAEAPTGGTAAATTPTAASTTESSAAPQRSTARPSSRGASAPADASRPSGDSRSAAAAATSRAARRRRARLRLVHVDAWSVMKTAFLLSIALGIVLVVSVSVIWAVLGSAGVWDSVNSVIDQAVGTEDGTAFDIQDYLGTSRVVGFAMIVAVLDVILITAIATLGAFLYNLAAALLGGIEVTLAEEK